MHSLTITEKLFALKVIEPFSTLTTDILMNLCSVSPLLTYEANQTIIESDSISDGIFVLVKGAFVTTKDANYKIIGANSVLYNEKYDESIVACPTQGAVCFRITKGHFLTLIYECPFFLTELLQLNHSFHKYCI